MKSIPRIIHEEVRSFLREVDEDIDDMYQARDNIVDEIFEDFLNNNTPDFTKNIVWQVVPYQRLKRVWEEYMKMGDVQNVKALNNIERIIIRNALRIDAITELTGHMDYGTDDLVQDNIGYWVDDQLNCIMPQQKVDTSQLEIPYENPEAGNKQKEPVEDNPCRIQIHPFAQEVIDDKFNPDNMDRENAKEFLMDAMQERLFDYYLTDPKSGHLYISDFGLPAIIQLTTQLYGEENPAIKVQTIDKILNVVHQRSDLASWFIQGGSAALSDLSGYEIPDEDDGGYDTKSVISGRYSMGDYK